MDILLVEDNAGDVRLTMEALKDAQVSNRLSVVTDGEEALTFLKRQGRHATAPRPDLILLDLNLPRRDGREVLNVIKNDVDLRRIPVIVLTISSAREDVMRAYDLHANCYITKPVDFVQFLDVVGAIEAFWFKTAKLPSE
jgi:two-component system, chemotaxis family, response regulator Rcp1